ncbi:MAG: SDR family NAD(P)-dependent oxidoreductase [Hyphomonas sp.]
MPDLPLQGKVVVITGAESGIGKAVAMVCASQGAEVCIAGINSALLSETGAEIARTGCQPLVVSTDITQADQIDRLFARIDERYGRLDAVVANAGIILHSGPMHETSTEDWDRTILTNLHGTFLTVRAGARYLIAQGKGGSILATGSSTAVRSAPGGAAYIASKGGVHALMQAMVTELGPYGIRVNTIVPGQTATPPLKAIPGFLEKAATQLPLGRVAEPEEIGRLVAFALSDAAPSMTGTLLKIDSGRTTA